MAESTISASASPALATRAPRAPLVMVAGVLCSGVLAWGWLQRHETDRIPNEGLGYALGVVGLAAMVLLLGYSLRKRWAPLRHSGPISRWFHVHMSLGLLGPTAILLHANFQLGSLNARVALASMLLVAGSGIIGRFVYTRVHLELHGRRVGLAELEAELTRSGRARSEAGPFPPEVEAVLARFERFARQPARGTLSAVLRALRVEAHRRWAQRVLARAAARRPGSAGARLLRVARRHIEAVASVSEFAAYERVFALWHALHLPLCVTLFGAAAVHVVAVHAY